MANVTRIGYGQVEPNHLSGIVEGRIYAQLPAATVTTSSGKKIITPIAQLEQGQFAKYDYATGVVNFDGDGDFYLVYNEEKLYDERYQSHKDFALKNKDFTTGNFHSGIGKNEITLDNTKTPPTTSLSTDGKFIYPRLIGTNVGDVITTNTIQAANTSNTAPVVIGSDTELIVGTYLQPSTSTGFLEVLKSGGNVTTSLTGVTGMTWKIVRVYTMPDGQTGYKIQRVQ